MRTLVRIFLLVVLVLSCTVSICAQEALWKELSTKVVKLYHQGRYSEAAEVAEEALTVAENTFGPNHSNVATSLNNLALVYRVLGRYSDAEPLYNRSLKIREKAFGKNHGLVAESLHNLALLYYYQDRYSEAELLYKRSLAIAEKAVGPEHPDVATTLENMAKLYKKIGKEVEAERLEARARIIRTGKDEMKQTANWSVNTYGFVMYVPGYELLSGLVTASSSFIILVVICCGLFKFFNITTQHPIRFYIWGIPIIAGIVYTLPLIRIDPALRESLEKLSYLIQILQVCTFLALSKPLRIIGRSRWAALWLIMPIYNMVVSWKWANEARERRSPRPGDDSED